MAQIKIWTLGTKNTDADREISWDSVLPNYADANILIINLRTLSTSKLVHNNREDHFKAQKAILDKCMNGGKVIIITASYLSRTIHEQSRSVFPGYSPRIVYLTNTNYDLSPISLKTESVPEGEEILYDKQGKIEHPFGSYLSNVTKFKFYLTEFDLTMIIKKGCNVKVLENYEVKDGSGHILGRGFQIKPGNGQIIFLPPPTLISTSEAINKIIKKLRDNNFDDIKTITRSYFSERIGKVPEHLSFDHLKSSIDIIYRQFITDGYFQKAFGFECIDAGSIMGDVKVGLHQQLILVFGERGKHMVPTTENIMNLDRDTLFDLIEFLYDYIAKPIDSDYHYYEDCGIHVKTASKEEGKKEWKTEINKLLIKLENSFRITEEGNIETLPISEGLRNLVDDHIPYGDADNVDRRVERACRLFLSHNSTIDNKKDAIRELADVLEFLRGKIKDKVFNKEASEIFNIANNFGIRHHDIDQKTGYDQESFYPWIFYAYLNTIDLLARLNKKDSNS